MINFDKPTPAQDLKDSLDAWLLEASARTARRTGCEPALTSGQAQPNSPVTVATVGLRQATGNLPFG
jgi:hypothetical protein